MSLWTKAILIGVVIEGILFSLMQASEFGPRGLGTSVGVVLAWVHIPAFFLMMPFGFVEWPKWVEAPMLFFFACLFWTLITYAFLVTRDRK